MIAEIRSEMRKTLTVRSTYIILGLGVALVALTNGWITGYKSQLQGGDFIAGLITTSVQVSGFLLGLIVLLQVTHEYRHNTIYHTLTLGKNRTAVMLAKTIVATLAVLVGTALIAATGVSSGIIGRIISGQDIGPQVIPWIDTFARVSVYSWGAGMYALFIGLLVRHQAGALVLYLFGISIIEQFLTLILAKNAGYLPFRALESILLEGEITGVFSYEKSMVVVVGWVIAFGLGAWALFVRRDAN